MPVDVAVGAALDPVGCGDAVVAGGVVGCVFVGVARGLDRFGDGEVDATWWTT